LTDRVCGRSDRRFALLIGWLLAAGAGLGAACADPVSLEDVTVTGSRLAVTDAATGSDVVLLPPEAVARPGTVSVGQTLSRFPQFVPAAGSTSNDPGNDGQANLSLRGIGAAQTLVMLDGRRLTPADGRGIVDVNLIPPALLSGVEIVTGGASAVYGSDAVAGVVNLRLKTSFEGVEARGSWGRTARGDGDEYSADLTAGTAFAAGRGSLVASAGYARRDLLYQGSRPWSRQPLRYYPDETEGVGPGRAFLEYGSGITAEGVNVVFSDPVVFDEVFAGYGFAPGSVPYYAGIGINPDGTLHTIGDQVHPGTVVNYWQDSDRPGYNDRIVTTNLAPRTALQLPLERKSLFARGSLEVADGHEAMLQLLLADYATSQVLGPVSTGALLAPPTNPYIPADLGRLLASRDNAQAPFRLLKNLQDLPVSKAIQDRQLVQVTAAADGVLAGRWTYQAHVQWGRNLRDEKRTGNALTGEIEALLNEPDGGQSLCGDFNLFGIHEISPACAARITADAENAMEVNQRVAEAIARGPLATLPAGEAMAAFGVFYKRDEFSFRGDPLAAGQLPPVPGIVGPRPVLAGFPIAPDRDGSESNVDLFTELRLPLWRSDGLERLVTSVGYRRAAYERAGDFDAWKADLLFRPASAWTLRGSYQRALRAPSIEELFYPALRGQLVVTPPDPCSVSSQQRQGPDADAVRSLCLEQGLPEALIDRFEYPLARVEGVAGGNPGLTAERSSSVTAGVEFRPQELPQAFGEWVLSLDAYRIELDNAIGRWETDTVIRRCFDPAYNPGYEAGNAYCGYFERSAVDGSIFSYEIDRNAGGIDTRGADLRLAWRGTLGPGQAGLDAYLGYLDDWSLREPHGGSVQLAGTIGGRTFGGSLPRWKALLSTDYAWKDWRMTATLTHVDGMRDAQYRGFTVSSVSYLDLAAALTLRGALVEDATLEFGVDNVTDREPPLFPSYQQANTDPSQYDVLGRRFWLALRWQF
jgi:iron complex outermembrane receptor protein